MDGFWKVDYELGRRFYLYGISGAGYDQVRKIDLRYEVGPGVGYHLVKHPRFVLNTEVGADYQVQNISNDSSTELFFLRLAENFTWRLNSKITLDEKFEFFPHVEDIDIYRFRFETNFRYQLLSNLALNLTVADQYDSQPADAVTKNDLQVRSSVGVKF
jgi:putative salt-induced outer membrane protein YdiY